MDGLRVGGGRGVARQTYARREQTRGEAGASPAAVQSQSDSPATNYQRMVHGRTLGTPVMAFAPVKIKGQLVMLAAYTCTPIVAFDIGRFSS